MEPKTQKIKSTKKTYQANAGSPNTRWARFNLRTFFAILIWPLKTVAIQAYKIALYLRSKIFHRNFVKILAIFFTLFLIKNSLVIEKIPQYKTITAEISTAYETVEFGANIVPAKIAKVTLPESQKIKKIYVKPGQYVKKGQIIAKLDDSSQYAQYRSALNSYYAAINARNSARRSQQTLNQTTDKFTDLIKQIKARTTDPQTLGMLTALEALVPTLKNSLNLGTVLGNTYQSSINMAYAQVLSAKSALEATKIKSPINGVVLVVVKNNHNVSASSSSTPNMAGFDISNLSPSPNTGAKYFSPTDQNLIIIADTKDWVVYPEFTQNEILKLKKGQKVSITINNTEKSGKVEDIFKSADSLSAEDPKFYAKISVSKVDKNTIPGMRVNGKVVVKTIKDAQLLPLNVIYYDEHNRPYVKILKDNNSTQVFVKLGVLYENKIQVVKPDLKDAKIIQKQEKPKYSIKFKLPWH